jgi:streptomycin 6-kinase
MTVTPAIRVPDSFAAMVSAREGDAGRAWIEQLPGLVAALCGRWGLRQDGQPMHGAVGLAVPVLRGREPCMLKVSLINEDSADEALALAVWDGNGAVRLLAWDRAVGAMLLERLDLRRSLASVDIANAVAIAGRLLRRLSVPAPVANGPDGSTAAAGPRRLRDVALSMSHNLPGQWQAAGQPFPRRLLEEAASLSAQLALADGRLLVNWDLHYENVLAGKREPWLVIDPKVIIGDPGFGVAPLLWNRFEEMDGPAGLRHRMAALNDAAGLDPERARAWTLVRTVNYWLWSLRVGLTVDPLHCQAITGWLADP